MPVIAVALASIIPGLGLWIAGRHRAAIGAFLIVFGLLAVWFVVPEGAIPEIACSFSILVWLGQIFLAAQSAKLNKRREAGEIEVPRESMPLTTAPPGASRSEKLAHKCLETIRQQLIPGEHLLDAIIGQEAGFLVFSQKQHYVGLTSKNLIMLELDILGKPIEVHRYPLSTIDSASFKKGIANDKLTFEIQGERKRSLTVLRTLREHSRNIANSISGQTVQK